MNAPSTLAAALALTSAPLAAQEAVDYTEPLTPENAAVLFIDNQSNLLLGVQSMDHTLLIRNTEGLAKLAALFDLPVVLTTTGGGAEGPAGPLMPSITETFPDEEVIDRQAYFNAMDDPRFAAAVEEIDRPKVILTGITTDYCLVYPAQTLIDQGYHVLVAVDTTGSWTSQIEEAAQSRLVQMGATLVNVQSIAGELQNALAVEDPKVAAANQPELLEWFAQYQPAPSLMLLPFAARLEEASAAER